MRTLRIARSRGNKIFNYVLTKAPQMEVKTLNTTIKKQYAVRDYWGSNNDSTHLEKDMNDMSRQGYIVHSVLNVSDKLEINRWPSEAMLSDGDFLEQISTTRVVYVR
jgi:hypothetical protein